VGMGIFKMVRLVRRIILAPHVALRSAVSRVRETILISVAVAVAVLEAETTPEKRRFFDQQQINLLLGCRRRARRRDPERALDLQRQADEAKSAGALEKAIRLYGLAIRCTPYNAALFFLRGSALLDVDRPRDAAKDFVAGLRFDPGNQTLTFLMHTANAKAAEQAAIAKAYRPVARLRNA
jgi:tetratricopeptide (TPR) repeat protein